ncbi:MAG: ABC transporter ATP-binding protein [Pseudomonadota bacterium]
MSLTTIKQMWALLDPQEKSQAFKVLLSMMVAAIASAGMIASVFPFLSVLSNPALIREIELLNWAYTFGQFETDYDFIVTLGISAIGVIIFANLILIVNGWIAANFIQKRMHTLSRKLLAHYLAQSYEFFLNQHSGYMSSNILSEVQVVIQKVLKPLADMASSALTTIAVIITLIVADPVVAIVSITAFASVYGAVLISTRRYVSRLGRRRARANRERFRISGEALSGIKDLKLLGREADYLQSFSIPSEKMANSQIGIAIVSQVPHYAIQMLAFGGIILLCLLSIDRGLLEQGMAVSEILPLVGLVAFAGQRLMPELKKFFQGITNVTAGRPALSKIYNEIFAEGKVERSIEYSKNTRNLRLNRSIELVDVSYTYPSADRMGLNKVTCTVRAGERIGIVGSSGAGKTTFADVILGLLRPQCGQILIDGQLLTGENLRGWQNSVGYVPQEIFLTDASLAENIALGLPKEKIDIGKVERAARVAQIHDFAMSELQDGYNSKLGERGIRLSGGQRQRIGIARALYNDADLILFDEATSALDTMTERDVMTAIQSLPGDKTVFVIAHRLTTVRFCDRILVLNGGQVEALASWDELSEQSESFKLLSARQ